MTYLSVNLRALVVCAALLTSIFAPAARSQEVLIFGSMDEVKQWMQAENWWGESKRSEQLQVPHAMITGFSDRWRSAAQKMPVPEKKEIFYRMMLPLIMHANTMVLDRRDKLLAMQTQLEGGKALSGEQLEGLRNVLPLLRIRDEEAAAQLGDSAAELQELISEALYKLDVIPAGLALGQAAYESGYGTSRFAVEGNALFGQWTYGGKGLKPEQQRKQLGDHRIASFDWPFDSVRGYFINLNSHPAYEDFRKLRASLKAQGKPLDSDTMAAGLIRYSERGQEYVDTLRGIMRVNNLAVADDAVFRNEPIRFLVGSESPQAAEEMRSQLQQMRASGELDSIIARMNLD